MGELSLTGAKRLLKPSRPASAAHAGLNRADKRLSETPMRPWHGPQRVPSTMPAPTLETPRLRLAAPGPGCEPAYERFYTDAAASSDYGGPISASAARARLASDAGAWQLQGFGVWAVHLKASADVVGVCGFWQGPGWPRELTWWLLPSARGQGLALEASRAVVAHAYSSFGWSDVQTYMNDANDAARALVVRLGGRRTGRQIFPDRLERDVYLIPPPTAGWWPPKVSTLRRRAPESR
jgi:[ribosomal protein S5]-alanine N-acetyltransferase